MAGLHLLTCSGNYGSYTAIGNEAGHAAGGFGRLHGIDVNGHAAIAFVGITQKLLLRLQAVQSCFRQYFLIQKIKLGNESGIDDIREFLHVA